MAKTRKTYRLSDEALAAAGAISLRDGLTETDAVEHALIFYAASGTTNSDGEGQPDGQIWREQLKVKDEQISALTAALAASQEVARAAQDTAKAAQLLHAADKPELLSQGEEGREPRRLTWKERILGWA